MLKKPVFQLRMLDVFFQGRDIIYCKKPPNKQLCLPSSFTINNMNTDHIVEMTELNLQVEDSQCIWEAFKNRQNLFTKTAVPNDDQNQMG